MPSSEIKIDIAPPARVYRTVAVALLRRLQTPTAGTVIGALLILLGGIISVRGASFPGTLVAAGGFGLVLKLTASRAARPQPVSVPC